MLIPPWQLWDGEITRLDAIVLLAVFGGLMAGPSGGATTEERGCAGKRDGAGAGCPRHADPPCGLLAGGRLALLIVSSRILVWGAVEIAHGFGVRDLIIVAVGTSLPELASSIIAARKGEHDIALDSILAASTLAANEVPELNISVRSPLQWSARSTNWAASDCS